MRQLVDLRLLGLFVGAGQVVIAFGDGLTLIKILRAFEAVDLNAKVDLISYQPLTPHPPNEERSRSVIGALLVQIGASLRW